MSATWSFVMPSIINIIKALLLLLVAFIVAAIVRKLISLLLKKIIPKKIAEKNIDLVKSIIRFVAEITYIIVFLLFIPAIFALLGVESASGPIVAMLEGIIAFIPNIIVAVLIIYIGVTLAMLCSAIVEKLIQSSNIDSRLATFVPEKKQPIKISQVSATFIRILLIIFFTVQGLNVLHLEILDKIGIAVIGYIPYVIAATLIFIGCFLLDTLVSNTLAKKQCYGLTMLLKVTIYVLGVFMMLSQLKIATTVVHSAFIIIITAIAVAFALSFGLGGRDFAGRLLRRIEDGWRDKR